MRLDAQVLRYMSKDEFRVLTSIELGMRNHSLVPTPLISRIASLSPSLTLRLIRQLHSHKLIYHEAQLYDGYRLTYLGYDFLALHALTQRGHLSALGHRIGVGKEADVYAATSPTGAPVVLKLHRLGRISFRRVKEKRDYLLHRTASNWLYLSRLAAQREWDFLQLLSTAGFDVPAPIDHSRHVLLMAYVPGSPLSQLRGELPDSLSQPSLLYHALISTIIRLAEHGLIHCDFNEFNLLLHHSTPSHPSPSPSSSTPPHPTPRITVIDFPQMVSAHHPNARAYFERDVEGVRRFFRKRFGYEGGDVPEWGVDVRVKVDLGVGVRASGSGEGGWGGVREGEGGAEEEERREFEREMERYNERQEREQEEGGEGEEGEEDEEVDVGDAIGEEDGGEGMEEKEGAEQADGAVDDGAVDERESAEQGKPEADEEEGEEEDEDEEEEEEVAQEDAAFRARMLRKEQRQQEERARQQKRLDRRQRPAAAQPGPSPQAVPSAVDGAEAGMEQAEEAVDEGRAEHGGDDGAVLVLQQQQLQLRMRKKAQSHRPAPASISRTRNINKNREAHKLKAAIAAHM